MAIFLCLIPLVIFSGYLIYPVALSAMAVIAVFEVLRVIGAHKNLAVAIPAYIFTAAFPILAYFVKTHFIPEYILSIAATMFVYMLWLMGASVFSKGKIHFSKISEVFISVIYVLVSFTSMSLIRYLNRDFGLFFVILVFLIPWMSDTFAYLVGMILGKHKLIPEVSPKKTVEGAIGGVVFSAIVCLIYGVGLDLFFAHIKVHYYILFVFGAILAVVSQLGDLVASLIKREYGVKDYGKIFPGHGGVMDRFDSVLAVSTILMILCIIFPPFVPI